MESLWMKIKTTQINFRPFSRKIDFKVREDLLNWEIAFKLQLDRQLNMKNGVIRTQFLQQ